MNDISLQLLFNSIFISIKFVYSFLASFAAASSFAFSSASIFLKASVILILRITSCPAGLFK